MPKSLHKPKKKLLPIRYTWEEKKCHILGTSTDLRGKKYPICTRKKDKKKDWDGGVVQ